VSTPQCVRVFGTRSPQGHAPAFDLGAQLYRLSGVDFTVIEGLNVLTVQTVLAEVGLEPSRFGASSRFCSWLGLCPANRITGGKVHCSRTRPVANRAATAFRLAAVAAGKTQGPLGQFYRRLRARLGAPKAVTATAHKLARLFFALWRDRRPFDPQRMGVQEQRNQQRRLRHLAQTARELGYRLVPQPVAAQ
jgi:transposase